MNFFAPGLLAGKRAFVAGGTSGINLAIAEAFRSGRLGIMDYYRMQNMQADTQMRGSIAGDGSKPTTR